MICILSFLKQREAKAKQMKKALIKVIKVMTSHIISLLMIIPLKDVNVVNQKIKNTQTIYKNSEKWGYRKKKQD